jgi:hypothetical protein
MQSLFLDVNAIEQARHLKDDGIAHRGILSLVENAARHADPPPKMLQTRPGIFKFHLLSH